MGWVGGGRGFELLGAPRGARDVGRLLAQEQGQRRVACSVMVGSVDQAHVTKGSVVPC